MTAMELIDKTERDDLEINNWERAIVWSALVLRASNVQHAENLGDDSYPYKDAVRLSLSRKIVDGALTATLKIEATMPYHSVDALSSGGSFLVGLLQFHDEEPEIYIESSCSFIAQGGDKVTPEGNGLPDDPPYIDTLELYFVWCCWEAELSLLTPLPNQLLPITVDFFEESQPNASIKVVANIPIDYEAYKQSHNLVCSVLPLSSQISPAGLRSFSWEEITNKPTFSEVATSGNYDDLANTPSIPSSLDELNRFNELIRTINGNAPNPNTGNIDITLDVGTVDWVNITNRPNFADVSVTGDYDDLINKPNIPILEWGFIAGKPTFAPVAFSNDYNDLTNKPSGLSSDWDSITNKPNFSAVALSGSYNDLTDKPNISGGGGDGGDAFLGIKSIESLTQDLSPTNIPFSSNGYNGIIDWIGTNEGTEAFSNPHTSGKVVVSNSPSNSSRLWALTDQATQSIGFIHGINMDIIMTFSPYVFNPSQISISCYNFNHNTPSTHEVYLSKDGTNWDLWGEFEINTSSSVGEWKNIVNTTTEYYKFLNIRYKSGHGSALLYTELNEVEVYGNVGIQSAQLESGDFYYGVVVDSFYQSLRLPALNTVALNDWVIIVNSFPFDTNILSTNSENIVSDSVDKMIKGNSSRKIIKVTETDWLMV